MMLKKNHENLIGNDKYEGFLVDLFARIAHDLHFDYELYESPDGNYGSKDDKGNWNGMIRELIVGVRIILYPTNSICNSFIIVTHLAISRRLATCNM